MADILITGGAGNFGRMLARVFIEQGHTLHLLDLPACDFSFCESWPNTKVYQGDILNPEDLADPAAQAEWVFHLAAILPPASENNRDLTFRVNVDGTQNLVDACASAGRNPTVVFASSISVYGDAGADSELISAEREPEPIDIYAESKVAAERVLMNSGLPWINLRISAIAIPEFLDPPEPWPFMPDQKIELVALSDLVRAMTSLIGARDIISKTLIISGGPTWQVSGEEYVRRWGEIMEIPYEEMSFLEHRGWLNWYDTAESQRLLDYQSTTLEGFFEELKAAVEEALV